MANYYGIQDLQEVKIYDWIPNDPGYLLKYNGENHVFTIPALRVLLERDLFKKWFEKEHNITTEEVDIVDLEEVKETEWEKFVNDYAADIVTLLQDTAKTCVGGNRKNPNSGWSVAGTPLYAAYGAVYDIDGDCYIYNDTNF